MPGLALRQTPMQSFSRVCPCKETLCCSAMVVCQRYRPAVLHGCLNREPVVKLLILDRPILSRRLPTKSLVDFVCFLIV